MTSVTSLDIILSLVFMRIVNAELWSWNNLSNNGYKLNDDSYLDTVQIAIRHGYTGESHIVQTPDGYLLTVHRITALNYTDTGKPPIYLSHALFVDSSWFVKNGNASLAFYLANAGYEIWLGNNRGNLYSRKHVSLTTNDVRFWDFRLEELAELDLPTMINYVKKRTGGRKAIFIGHSMGNTLGIQYAATLPKEAKDSVLGVLALGPVAYTEHLKSPMRLLAPYANDLARIFRYVTKGAFLPNYELIQSFVRLSCRPMQNKQRTICFHFLNLFAGVLDQGQITDEKILYALNRSPSGTSIYVLVEFEQRLRENGRFQLYDYGPKGNFKKYGTKIPPEINVTHIEVPVYLYYGQSDQIGAPEDVLKLYSRLGKFGRIYRVNYDKFDHMDFVYAKDAVPLLYERVLSDINNLASVKA